MKNKFIYLKFLLIILILFLLNFEFKGMKTYKEFGITVKQCKSSNSEYLQLIDFNDGDLAKFGVNDNNGEINIDNTGGVDSSKCLKMTNTEYGTSFFYYTFDELNDQIEYTINVSIKTENIERDKDFENNSGFYLYISDGYQIGKGISLTGTNKYQNLEIIAHPKNKKITILGYLECSNGTVYIDNISIKKSDLIYLFGNKNKIFMKANDDTIKAIGSKVKLQELLDNLEKAYYDNYELTSCEPIQFIDNDTKKMIMIDLTKNIEHTAVAYITEGVIYANAKDFNQDISKIKKRGNKDWNFMLLHELGHLFDYNTGWCFEAEAITDLKIAYVLEKNNVGAAPAELGENELFISSKIKDCYYKMCKEYYNFLGSGEYDGGYDFYGAAYKLLSIKNQIGWDAFKQTFSEMYTTDGRECNLSDVDRFNNFIKLLSKYSKKDVKSLFTTKEWEAVIKYCGGYSSNKKINVNLLYENITIEVGKSKNIIKENDSNIDLIDFTSDSINIATVSSGKVSGLKEGTAIIKAKAKNSSGTYKICKVKVVKPKTKKLSSIYIQKAPSKVKYKKGQNFQTKGIVVYAKYTNGSKKKITNYKVLNGKKLTCNRKYVTISYTENGITKKVNQKIKVYK